MVRVCTCATNELPAAWADWISHLPPNAAENEAAYPANWRDLLPLVALLQRTHNLAGPDWLLSRLRTAAVLEERRLASVRSTTAEILAIPEIAAAEPLVIGGLGIGETVYPDPASRHTGILSIMLAAGTNLHVLARQLAVNGFRIRQAGKRSRHWPFLPWARAWLWHKSGFQVYLISAPFWRAGHRLGHKRLMRGAMQVDCPGGLSFRTPRFADAMALIAVGIGREHSLQSLLPAVDTALLQRHHLGQGEQRTGDGGCATPEPSAHAGLPLAAPPFLSRLRRWLRDRVNVERRAERRLLRESPHRLFQIGGRTAPDRYPHLFAALRDSLSDIPSPEILSFGCSTGEEIVSLRTYIPAGRFAGIDINGARIGQARAKLGNVSVRLWAAASIEESGAGTFDAISCLSVLQHNVLVKDWPEDCTPYMTFGKFETAVIDLDRHLKVGGMLLLYHTSFRFADTRVADRYTPLLVTDLLVPGSNKRYDRNNRRTLEPPHERFALWRKER